MASWAERLLNAVASVEQIGRRRSARLTGIAFLVCYRPRVVPPSLRNARKKWPREFQWLRSARLAPRISRRFLSRYTRRTKRKRDYSYSKYVKMAR